MADPASQLSRDAKKSQHELKELLKNHEPWEKEVEFHRKELRRAYLRLLLLHPYARESKDVETALWMQTSHQFIAEYKKRITELDRAIHPPPAVANTDRGSQTRQHQQHQDRGGHGPVEYRKLLQRFRQFLAEEEKFWSAFVVRFRSTFDLKDATPSLVVLGILPDEEAPEAHAQEVALAAAANSARNRDLFPPEEAPNGSVAHTAHAQREGQLSIMGKALVCLGDIARYKELYNESGGRPRAGHEHGPQAIQPKRGGRSRRGGGSGGQDTMMMPARERNYDKSQKCYEQARMLVPAEGNPSHQLAILASYKKDNFGSLVHYYRALCVKQPYETASENMTMTLKKALAEWTERKEEEEKKELEDLEPRHKVSTFKRRVVALHAFWRLGGEKIPPDAYMLTEKITRDFTHLVSNRVLPIETISQVVVLSLGALYSQRMHRDWRDGRPQRRSPSTSGTNSEYLPSSSISPSALLVESHVASHVLAVHRVLMSCGAAQLREKLHDVDQSDLAQKITAVFRRTLPALRIAGKWLRVRIRYVSCARDFDSDLDLEERPTNRSRGKKATASGIIIKGLDAFWTEFIEFMNSLSNFFPLAEIPKLVAPLEEDLELYGFLPLKHGMLSHRKRSSRDGDGLPGPGEGHPNDEQLMRIWDILVDARAVAETEASPVMLRNGRFVRSSKDALDKSSAPIKNEGVPSRMDMPQRAMIPKSPANPPIFLSRMDVDVDEDLMTEASRTDDDPVAEAGKAFQQGLGDEDDQLMDDNDEVVYNPRPMLSPIGSRPAALSPPGPPSLLTSVAAKAVSPPSTVMSMVPPQVSGASLPNTPKSIRKISGTTPQDLLKMKLNELRASVQAPERPRRLSELTPPSSHPHFAPPPFNGLSQGQSIWSTTSDNNSIPPPVGMSNGTTGGQFHYSPHQQSQVLFPQGHGLSPSTRPLLHRDNSPFGPGFTSPSYALPQTQTPVSHPGSSLRASHQRSLSTFATSSPSVLPQTTPERYDSFMADSAFQQQLNRLPINQYSQDITLFSHMANPTPQPSLDGVRDYQRLAFQGPSDPRMTSMNPGAYRSMSQAWGKT